MSLIQIPIQPNKPYISLSLLIDLSQHLPDYTSLSFTVSHTHMFSFTNTWTCRHSVCIHTYVHTHAHTHLHTHLHTHRISYPERECCIGFSSGSAAPPKLWSDERRRAVSIGPERGVVKRVLCMYVCVCVGGGAEPVVCLPDAGLPARRGEDFELSCCCTL